MAGGIPGKRIVAYLVKELPVNYLYWLVVVVLLYASVTPWSSSSVSSPVAA